MTGSTPMPRWYWPAMVAVSAWPSSAPTEGWRTPDGLQVSSISGTRTDILIAQTEDQITRLERALTNEPAAARRRSAPHARGTAVASLPTQRAVGLRETASEIYTNPLPLARRPACRRDAQPDRQYLAQLPTFEDTDTPGRGDVPWRGSGESGREHAGRHPDRSRGAPRASCPPMSGASTNSASSTILIERAARYRGATAGRSRPTPIGMPSRGDPSMARRSPPVLNALRTRFILRFSASSPTGAISAQ